jgi:hypothetical protein
MAQSKTVSLYLAAFGFMYMDEILRLALKLRMGIVLWLGCLCYSLRIVK